MTTAAVLEVAECECCGRSNLRLSGHHIIPRSEGGDDVRGNVLVCCGDGTTLCHGALEGNPYWITEIRTDGNREIRTERRLTPREVRMKAALAIWKRPDAIDYVMSKLGTEQGIDYLERRYGLLIRPRPGEWGHVEAVGVCEVGA